jgi:hypothetical protein
MKIDDLIQLYEEKRKVYGADVYKHISELFDEAKKLHHKDWMKHPTAMNDHEQSWRAWKEKILKNLFCTCLERK